MNCQSDFRFKIANEAWEFELIHQLNYKTFVLEIPQHPPQAQERLVDKFHAENTYLICVRARQLIGMLAVRARRPFSLESKLPDLHTYLPTNRSVCEVRLLAVERDFRYLNVFQGLLSLLWQYFIKAGYDLAIISGTTRQQKLYRHLGFIPFGPLVGSGDVLFQPMYLPIEVFEQTSAKILSTIAGAGRSEENEGPVVSGAAAARVAEQTLRLNAVAASQHAKTAMGRSKT